ncbi:hypothetical protein Hden_2968 [Hyphomicrobium denitrificans ATCC 51888]|uniref:Uncharacterized protein n=1 Tax=Hyphomicrobium denitrificans (strain ATCC 51888 / DSM 1869 / NCIMB 11706 / TK 0415) TaxID=582899 RepID=D8JVA9_HYPDA|nr:hypothetical protein [Hyphomicrobium denitrificans]ADJ24763.1 hypothetical protein Hden_2968 [Hyphomicrobium denitrificans ATCC 51888]
MTDFVHPFEIEIAGRQLFFERTLELARRVESVTGALYPFAERLDRGHVTTSELARVYNALLRTDPDAPGPGEIDDWIFRCGTFSHRRLAAFLTQLVAGSDNLAREAQRLADNGKGGDRRGPFVPTA